MKNMATLLRFLGTGLVWGGSYLFIAIALENMSWQFLVWIRPLIGLATLGVILAVRRPKDSSGRILPRKISIWLRFTLVGLTFTAIPSALCALAMGTMSSSTVSIYNATVPLFTALVAGLIFKSEKLKVRNWLGVLIGLTGVFLVISPWERTQESVFGGELAVLAAVLSVAFAYVYQKKHMTQLDADPVVVAFLITFGASVISIVLTPWMLVGPINMNFESWLALAVLGIGTGAFGYVWNAQVVYAWGATAGSMVAYLSPVIGVTLGAFVLGEAFTLAAAVGTLIIFGGIAVDRSARAKSAF